MVNVSLIQRLSIIFLFLFISNGISINKEEFRLKAKEMFLHAFENYMKYAYPADELMPLSCKGRYRGIEPSRGDIDDVLGNFSLTLIDSLDTIYIMNELEMFERSVKFVINNVKFDTNITVSVFEVNIRVVGGLLGAHIAAINLQKEGPKLYKDDMGNTKYAHYMKWYKDELLWMADDIAKRLLPAFDTPTGIPYPRINLMYGHTSTKGNSDDVSTCTACAGTIILEFAALSRLTGNPIYELKASKALTYIWQQRNRFSNLVGTIINIHDGNWMKKESGVGAGIDSYYEYLLKAYVLLGDDTYLHRFSIHYDAIKRYISTSGLSTLPPLLLDVKMHQPLQRVKNFMDSLLAFWPGLQVLYGDLKQAVAIHEIMSQVMKRHNFLPEAFTTDFHVYWGHHLLRPEFLESNYFLYHSTGDSYYLDIGVQVLENLETHARVKCGFAAIQDLRTMNHSDQMDSFVLAETFKYLYLLFAESSHLPLNMDNYIFTTEGHILPLNLALKSNNPYMAKAVDETLTGAAKSPNPDEILQTLFTDDFPKDNVVNSKGDEAMTNENQSLYNINNSQRSCENHMLNADAPTIIKWVFLNAHKDMKPPIYRNPAQHLAALIREPLKNVVIKGGFMVNSNFHRTGDSVSGIIRIPLLPKNLLPHNPDHVNLLKKMGIQIHFLNDGRMQLFHQPNMADSEVWAAIGENFMTEMMKLTQSAASSINFLYLTVLINETKVVSTYKVAPAQFGTTIKSTEDKLGPIGLVTLAEPFNACTSLVNPVDELFDKIVIAKRGDCMFIEKARNIQRTGAIGALFIDNAENSSFDSSALFSMSGDGTNDVNIPVVFMFHREGQQLLELINNSGANNVSLIFSSEEFNNEKVSTFAQTTFESKAEPISNSKSSKYQKKEDYSSVSHARIDLHFLRVNNTVDSINRTIFDIERIQIEHVHDRQYEYLEQFRLRIFPNELLSKQYNKLERDTSQFSDSVIEYVKKYSNIASLDQMETFFTILKWAVFYESEFRIMLPLSTRSAIECLSSITNSLESEKYQNTNDLAMPTVTSHAVSFDVNIYLTDLGHYYDNQDISSQWTDTNIVDLNEDIPTNVDNDNVSDSQSDKPHSEL